MSGFSATGTVKGTAGTWDCDFALDESHDLSDDQRSHLGNFQDSIGQLYESFVLDGEYRVALQGHADPGEDGRPASRGRVEIVLSPTGEEAIGLLDDEHELVGNVGGAAAVEADQEPVAA